MEREIIKVVRYFARFEYPPTELEIYTFISLRISKVLLKKRLDILIKEKKLIQGQIKGIFHYGLVGKKNLVDLQEKRERYSAGKIKKIRLYLQLLSFFPQIKLVGLSGSMAMMNAEENDDIDLFVITAKNRLFTGRIIALVLAQLLGLRRTRDSNKQFFYNEPHPECEQITSGSPRSKKIAFFSSHKDKVCLNLFFDERNLKVPKFKRSEYVAHEVLQMKPIIDKDYSYGRFLEANRWVSVLFPNISWINSKLKTQNSKPQFKNKNFKFLIVIFNFSFLIFNWLGDEIEAWLKIFQLAFINRHRTREIVTDTQLWFFPEDFEKKMI